MVDSPGRAMWKTAFVLGLTFVAEPSFASQVTFLEQAGYGSIADSPFDTKSGYFHLDDFEDGQINSLGLVPSHGPKGDAYLPVVRGPSEMTHSVGNGVDGYSVVPALVAHDFLDPQNFWTATSFDFDANSLGFLPTYVGFALTATVNQDPSIRVQVFGADGQLAGELVRSLESPSNLFIGAVYESGISAITIRSRTVGSSAGFELDHVQYGTVPEPSTLGLALVGLVAAIFIRRT